MIPMRREGNKLVFGRNDCYCGDGKVSGTKKCTGCNGTGKGKRGKVRGCRFCYGRGTQPDFENQVTCNTCNGNPVDFQGQNICDYLPEELWLGLNFKVYRRNRGMSLAESLIGLGCVFSCVDYGKAQNQTDDLIIEDVKSHKGIQATKVVRDDMIFCDHVGIFVGPDGYTVKGVWLDDASTKVESPLENAAV